MAKHDSGSNSFTTTISLDRALYREFQQIAEQRHQRTARQQVRHLIAEWVKQEKAAA